MPMRLTFDASVDKGAPVWSPDGTEVLFDIALGGKMPAGIYRKSASGTGNEELLAQPKDPDAMLWPTDWSKTGDSSYACRERSLSGTEGKFGYYRSRPTASRVSSFARRVPPTTASFLPTVTGLPTSPRNPAVRRCMSCRSIKSGLQHTAICAGRHYKKMAGIRERRSLPEMAPRWQRTVLCGPGRQVHGRKRRDQGKHIFIK